MLVRTSYKGLVIWFFVSGLLALIGLGIAASESDPSCNDFGYFKSGSYTCEASSGLTLAYFFGGNCLLALLSLLWASAKKSRGNTNQQDFVVYSAHAQALAGVTQEFLPPTLGSGSRGNQLDSEGQSLVANVGGRNSAGVIADNEVATDSKAQSVPIVEPELRASSVAAPDKNGGPGYSTDSETGQLRGSENTSSTSPSVRRPEAPALIFQRRASLRFNAIKPVSIDEVSNAVRTSESEFLVTEELQTAIFLAAEIKNGGDYETVSGLELVRYFSAGATIGKLLFAYQRTKESRLDQPQVLDVSDLLDSAINQSRELEKIELETLNELLDSFPSAVSNHLTASLASKQISDTEKELLTRMFGCGIVFIGFNSPSLPEEPTW